MSVQPRRAPHPFALSLGAVLLCTACDKKDEAADGSAAKAAEDEAKKKAAEDEAKKKAAEDEAKKKAAEDEAKKKAIADEEAKKKAAEDEAKRKAEEEAKKPLSLTDIQVKSTGMFGSGGALTLTAKAKLNETLNNGTFVHLKALCKRDTRLIADVGWLGVIDTKQLHQFAIGETADLQANVFSQGAASPMSPCQLDFRLGSGGGGVSVPLRTACYDGTTTKEGPCEPPVVAAAMSGASLPLEVFDLAIKGDTGFGSSPGIQVDELLQINTPIDDTSRVTVKSSCTVGAKKYVDLQALGTSAGPFIKFESGESLLRPTRLYYNPAFGFTEPPKLCDVTFAVWKTKPGSWSEFDQTVVKRACFKDDKVADGPCDPAAAAPPAPTPMTAASLVIDNVKIELITPYGVTGGQFNVKVDADVTIKLPVDQPSGIDANVTCKLGSTERVDKSWINGVEYFYLDPGETTRLTGQAFSSEVLAGTPKSCEVSFTGIRRFGTVPGEKPVELGKWCLKKDKLKQGKC